jgi:hypothetical protein
VAHVDYTEQLIAASRAAAERCCAQRAKSRQLVSRTRERLADSAALLRRRGARTAAMSEVGFLGDVRSLVRR